MKKVLHIITTIEFGGAEKQLLVLTKTQILEGRLVEVLYLKGSPELLKDFEDLGVKVSTKFSNISPPLQALKILVYLKKNRYEIVHAHLPRAELICAALSYFQKSNFFYTRHNAEKFFPKGPGFVSRLLSRSVSNRFECGIAISQAVKNFLLENKEIAISSKLLTIYYGFYPGKSDNSLNCEKSPFNDRKYFTIGTIARLTAQKNLPTLIKSVFLLKNKLDLNLLILGDGPKKNELQKLIDDLCLTENVKILPRTREIEEFLKSLDAFVLPSFYEGFGLVLLEAMNMQIPIIASDNSAIPEVMGKDYQFLFNCFSAEDLASKILDITEIDKVKLINYLRNRLDFFNAEKMCKQVSEMYESSYA
jgi:glycosyltransferase involved in cell wall biosynthesis